VLADQMARQGFHVMRFDYFATGDSAGDDGEGDLDGWCQDVLSADNELRQRSGCGRITWFGHRLGASIAALASKHNRLPVKQILLWDPVIDGPDYLREMVETHLNAYRDSFGERWIFDQRLRSRAASEAKEEATGFALPSVLRQQLEQLSVKRLAAAEAGHIALLAKPALPGLSALQEQFNYFGKPVSTITLGGDINWASNEAMNTPIVPTELLKSALSLLKEE
jgi:pimeloyl-ACP methyl ester carboxylesterase